jgi:hypothetical protein
VGIGGVGGAEYGCFVDGSILDVEDYSLVGEEGFVGSDEFLGRVVKGA